MAPLADLPHLLVVDDDTRLRALLARYLKCAPDAVPLRVGEFGKPYLDPPHALEFNLSHSKDALLIGLSRSQPLGVDIETRGRQRPVQPLAQRFFAPDEAAALQALDPGLRQNAFLGLWSCKEAVVKALGRGIAFGLDRVMFALDAAGRTTRLNVIDTSAGAVAEWQIVVFQPSADHAGALAWRGPARQIRAFAATPP
jgi:4'-phosphopantetheinyl transferase